MVATPTKSIIIALVDMGACAVGRAACGVFKSARATRTGSHVCVRDACAFERDRKSFFF